jgi:ubiquinone/menaquinone biosynthesis C-methylase UbiE
MVHKDHVSLIQDGIGGTGGVWADLGSGTGAFTLALRDVGGESIKIYSVDQDLRALDTQKIRFSQMFPGSNVTYIKQNFAEHLELPPLDGIIMANSLHYIEDQASFLKNIKKHLKPHGKFVLVEYNTEKGNQWVPYAVSFRTFASLATTTGFEPPKLLRKIPSEFLKEMYSAVTVRI